MARLDSASYAGMEGPRQRLAAERTLCALVDVECWGFGAPEAHPLKRSLLVAMASLTWGNRVPQGPTAAGKRARVARMRRLLQVEQEDLARFSVLVQRELMGEMTAEALLLFPKNPIDVAVQRARERWRSMIEAVRRTPVSRGGRPRSDVGEALNGLCAEIVKSPLCAEELKRRVTYAVAEWAAELAGGKAETYRNAIERARRNPQRRK